MHGDTGPELKLQWCWQRRGVAFDRCGLMSWSVHEKWVSTMLSNLSKETPRGFSNSRTEQLIRADRELFTILSQEHVGTLLPDAAGVSPLDTRVQALMTDPRVTMFMLPLPSPHRAIKEDVDKSTKAEVDKPPKPPQKKAKEARAEKSCPDEFKKDKMDYAHGRICWGFNMKDGCSLSTQKQDGKPSKCNKGYHVCANCQKAGAVLRLADQQTIDRAVKEPQKRLQLRLRGRPTLQWKVFHNSSVPANPGSMQSAAESSTHTPSKKTRAPELGQSFTT